MVVLLTSLKLYLVSESCASAPPSPYRKPCKPLWPSGTDLSLTTAPVSASLSRTSAVGCAAHLRVLDCLQLSRGCSVGTCEEHAGFLDEAGVGCDRTECKEICPATDMSTYRQRWAARYFNVVAEVVGQRLNLWELVNLRLCRFLNTTAHRSAWSWLRLFLLATYTSHCGSLSI